MDNDLALNLVWAWFLFTVVMIGLQAVLNRQVWGGYVFSLAASMLTLAILLA